MHDQTVEFRVLGRLEVLRDGKPAVLGNAFKPRVVLAALLTRPDQQVSPDWLSTVVWGTDLPPSARRNLQLYVHRLRKAIGSELIMGVPGGYRIVAGDNLDAVRFEALALEGQTDLRASRFEAAETRLRSALDLWRGPAFAEFGDNEQLADEAARLEDLRLACQEGWLQAGTSLGRGRELVPTLNDLVRRHPYRENLLGLHMLALYQSGSQTEALEAFRRARQTFADQLGIDPGPGLRQLHESILRGDTDLMPPGVLEQAVVAPLRVDARPYQGLTAFEPQDAEWFFGRDRLVRKLLDRVRDFGLVGVFGASGSGKSSLLRAGLLGSAPDNWRRLLLTPSRNPVRALADAITRVTGGDPAALADELDGNPAELGQQLAAVRAGAEKVLVVVDQFEELFTLVEEGERKRFVDLLLSVATGRVVVVLGIRADFLGHVSSHPGLLDALEGPAQVLVGPPSALELRQIVAGPAARAGLRIEGELLTSVLADAGAEPGALPLVSHALLETWRLRDGRDLTLAMYRAIGGVQGALSRTAEQVYAGFDPEQSRITRLVFLRLVSLDPGMEGTRRPVLPAELDGIGRRAVVREVLDRLVAARLVVVGDRGVELAHEVLIGAWPRLKDWLREGQADLVVHRRITAAAEQWRSFAQDPAALYRGAQLENAHGWSERNPGELNRLEEDFLSTSRARERDELTTVRRRNRRLRVFAGALVVFLALAIIGGSLAVRQSDVADRRRLVEQSHQIALQARALIDADPELAGLLALQAYRLNPDEATAGALLSAAGASRRRLILNQGGPSVFKVAFSPDGTLLASADSAGAVSLWDPMNGSRKATFTDQVGKDTTYARTVAFSADGRLLASTARVPGINGSAGSLVVRRVADHQPVLRRAYAEVGDAMAISRDGSAVAVARAGGIVELVPVDGSPVRVLRGGKGEVHSLAFSADGRWLIVAGDGAPQIWDTQTGRIAGSVGVDRADEVSFDSTGKTLMTSARQDRVRFWTFAGGRAVPASPLPPEASWSWDVSTVAAERFAVADEHGLITLWDTSRNRRIATFQDRGRAETLSLALSPDGRRLASAGFGQSIVIRDLTDGFTGHEGAVTDLDVSPDGQTIASAGTDGTVRLWDRSGRPIGRPFAHTDQIEATAFSPDGRRLAVLTRNHELTVQEKPFDRAAVTVVGPALGMATDVGFRPGGSGLVTLNTLRYQWSAALRPAPFPGSTVALSLAFTPDGALLFTGSPAGLVNIWDLAASKPITGFRTGQGAVTDVAVSPDGKLLATAGTDRTVKLWNVADRSPVATLTGHTAPVQVIAFSRDGRTLASGSHDHTITLWRLADFRSIASLTGHTGRVQALAFTDDGELLSGADESRIITWPGTTDAAHDKICGTVSRDLTAEERHGYLFDLPAVAACPPG